MHPSTCHPVRRRRRRLPVVPFPAKGRFHRRLQPEAYRLQRYAHVAGMDAERSRFRRRGRADLSAAVRHGRGTLPVGIGAVGTQLRRVRSYRPCGRPACGRDQLPVLIEEAEAAMKTAMKTLGLAGVLLIVAVIPVEAQQTDSRWAPWLGCWQLVDE